MNTNFVVSANREVWLVDAKKIFAIDHYIMNEIQRRGLEVKYEEIKVANIMRANREELQNDHDYVDEKYKKYIPILINRLNYAHKLNYEEQFWRRALSLAILRHVTICYDIFKSCENNLNLDEHDCKIIDEKSYYLPQNFDDHRRYFLDTNLGREQLFSVYCKIKNINKFQKINVKNYWNLKRKENYRWKENIKKQLLRLRVNRIKNWIFRNINKAKNKHKSYKSTMGVIGCYFSERNRERLENESFGRIKKIEIKKFPELNKHINWSMRHQITSYESNFDDFDKFVFETLRYGMPKLLVEEFNYNYDNLNRYFDTNFPNLKTVLCESWIGSSKDAFAIAVLSNRGVEHLSIEHNYISHCYLGSNLKYLAPIADKYITFGWKDSTIKNTICGSSLYTWVEEVENKIKKHKILLILSALIACIPEISAAYGGNGAIGVIRTIKMTNEFLSALDETTLHETYIRSYPRKPLSEFLAWDNNYVYKEYISKAKIYDDVGIVGSRVLMQESEIVIVNYLATSYLESLKANIPTIVLYDKQSMHLQEKFANIFDGLIKVGIFQINATSAAKFVNKIKDNPQIWWNSDNVQKYKNKFLNENFGDEENMIKYLVKYSKK